MPDNADPTVTGKSGAAADTAAELKKLIHDTINEILPKAIHARVSRTEESLAEVVKAELAKMSAAAKPADQVKTPEGDQPAGDQQRLTVKAVQESFQAEIAALKKGIADERKARAEAEQKEVATRTRSEVQSHFAKHLGADSPHIRPYVNEYMAQFEYKDGAVVRKTKDDYGMDQFVPVDQAVASLMQSDLKHLVPARNGKLPPAGMNGLNGSPYSAPRPPEVRGMNMLDRDLIEAVAKDRPELAQALFEQAQANANASGNNGTPQK